MASGTVARTFSGFPCLEVTKNYGLLSINYIYAKTRILFACAFLFFQPRDQKFTELSSSLCRMTPSFARSLRLVASLSLALAWACSRDSAPSPSSESKKRDGATRSLVLYTWADYVPGELLDRFARSTGIDVQYRSYENTDELTSELASRPELYDIIITDGYTVNRLVKNQFVAPFDRDLLPHFENIDTQFRGLEFDPENHFSVPYLWGSTLIAYDSKRITPTSRSWSLLWDAEILGDGPVYLVDEPIDLFSVALLERGDSINHADSRQLSQAADRLREQFHLVDVRHADALEIRNALETGDCAAAMIYSGDALMAKRANPDIEILVPENGVPLWIDHFLLSRESRSLEPAHALVDFLLEGENAAACANYACSPSPNRAATPYLDATLTAGGAGIPNPDVLARSEFLNGTAISMLRQIALLMRDIKACDAIDVHP